MGGEKNPMKYGATYNNVSRWNVKDRFNSDSITVCHPMWEFKWSLMGMNSIYVSSEILGSCIQWQFEMLMPVINNVDEKPSGYG